jgi:hypothetical protein
MKNFYFLLSATLFFASCGPTTVIQSDSYQPAPVAPAAEISYQSFYDQLSPYGNWINYPGYGYVWSPNAGPDFQPYATNGNWIYTEAGWTWASNYNWGWAPFHYGRWFYENGYGWMWIPGSEWAPAWVSWRGGGDYYGWAPLGPSVSVNVALSNYNPPANYWNFVPRQYMGNPNWHNYYVGGSGNVTIINNTTIINNYSGTDKAHYAYAPGPDPNEVRRYSGNNFTLVQLRQSSTPGARISGSQYQIYQPRVSATPAALGDASARPANPAPARYETFNNTHPSNQYTGNQPANNPRPAEVNPGNNHPGNNHPVNNQPVNNQPVNNQPANNPRPAGSNSGNNQPVNNQPVNNQPVNNQPANNPRSAGSNPGNNQPVNNQPAYNPRPATSNPGNNQPVYNRPANNHGSSTPNPTNNPPVNNKPAGDPRPSNYQKTGNVHPAPNSSSTQHPPTNAVQPAARPAANRNPNSNHPAPKPAPAAKPAPKPVTPPKIRDDNSN